jgi:hypothetical protein
VAGALLDLKCTTLSTRLEPLHGRAFINKRFADDEVAFVKRNTVAVREDPGVGDCRLNYLEYRLRSCLGGKLQNCQSLVRLLTTNKVDDAPGLHRRYADVARNCLGFHCFPSLVFDVSAGA